METTKQEPTLASIPKQLLALPAKLTDRLIKLVKPRMVQVNRLMDKLLDLTKIKEVLMLKVDSTPRLASRVKVMDRLMITVTNMDNRLNSMARLA